MLCLSLLYRKDRVFAISLQVICEQMMVVTIYYPFILHLCSPWWDYL